MLNPSNPTLGRGLLLFAALLLGLSGYLAAVEGLPFGRWQDAAMWLAVAVFMACYGLITLGALARWHRSLLLLGFAAGAVAFVIAVQLASRGP